MKPRSRAAGVEKIDGGHYHVKVAAVPERGRANNEMIQLLADYFHVPKSSVRLVMGKTAREKLVEILGA